jgi:putative membrane protein
MSERARNPGIEMGRGLLVGLSATQALDWVSIALYESEDAPTRASEDHARGHRHAYERAIEKLAKAAGWRLDDEGIGRWGWRFHKAFGLLGGPAYLALRRQFPRLGWGCGVAFGLAFFLLVDEVLVPASGLTPGPLAFSWKVHARGAAAHLAYGVAAEATARLLAAT